MEQPIKNASPAIPSSPPPPRRRRNRRLYATACCLTVLLIIFLVLLIIALTVFKPRDPTISLTSITLTGVSPTVVAPLQVSLNLSLHIQISVYNPNRASFSHDAGSTDVDYRGNRVGHAVIAEGRIPSRGSAYVNVDLALQSYNFTVNAAQLLGDVLAGEIAFDSASRISGRVRILGFVRKHAVAYAYCRVAVGVPTLEVRRQDCDQKTKL